MKMRRWPLAVCVVALVASLDALRLESAQPGAGAGRGVWAPSARTVAIARAGTATDTARNSRRVRLPS